MTEPKVVEIRLTAEVRETASGRVFVTRLGVFREEQLADYHLEVVPHDPVRQPFSWTPDHPCRVMPTRACPASYHGVCGKRPCARFESEDEGPWLANLTPIEGNTNE